MGVLYVRPRGGSLALPFIFQLDAHRFLEFALDEALVRHAREAWILLGLESGEFGGAITPRNIDLLQKFGWAHEIGVVGVAREIIFADQLGDVEGRPFGIRRRGRVGRLARMRANTDCQ